MQLVEIVLEVLEKGEISMSLERRMHYLLETESLNEAEIAAIEALMEAICEGRIRSVPDRTQPQVNEVGQFYK